MWNQWKLGLDSFLDVSVGCLPRARGYFGVRTIFCVIKVSHNTRPSLVVLHMGRRDFGSWTQNSHNHVWCKYSVRYRRQHRSDLLKVNETCWVTSLVPKVALPQKKPPCTWHFLVCVCGLLYINPTFFGVLPSLWVTTTWRVRLTSPKYKLLRPGWKQQLRGVGGLSLFFLLRTGRVCQS